MQAEGEVTSSGDEEVLRWRVDDLGRSDWFADAPYEARTINPMSQTKPAPNPIPNKLTYRFHHSLKYTDTIFFP